jgi:hypothetical protein
MISTSFASAHTRRLSLWLERALFVTVLLACAVALSPSGADPDFWGHVQYGRDALASGLPTVATYTYTAEGSPWINHENVSELLMAWGVAGPGPAGMLIIKTGLGLGLMVLIYRHAARQDAARTPTFLSMLLVAVNLMPCWTLRPQLMTYTLLTLMIILLDWCFADWRTPWRALLGREPRSELSETARVEYRRRWPWLLLLAPLFVLWVNSHGGFVAGYCLLVAYLGGRSLEALVCYRRRGLPLVAWLVVVVLACGLATLVNPYGIGLHRWLWSAMQVPPPEIMEWNPPELWSLAGAVWWTTIGISVAALAMTRRRRDLVQIVLLGLTMWQSCEYRRHIAFYAILFGFWMPLHIDSWLSRMRSRHARDIRFADLSPARCWMLFGVLLLAIGLMAGRLFFRLHQIPVRCAEYPVSAFQYITDRNLQGNLVVKMKWAQYAIAAFGAPSPERPCLRVAFDGRFDTCYPQEMLDRYFDFEIGDAPLARRRRSPLSPPVDGSRVLEYKRPNLVLIDRATPHFIHTLRRHEDQWTLLYQDSIAQLWGRREVYDDVRSADYLPLADRTIGETPQTGAVPWPALPQRRTPPPQLSVTD